MKKKVKIAIIVLVAIFIVLLIVLGTIKNKERQAQENNATNTISEDQYIVSTKKITKYLDIMNGDHLIRYKTTIKNSEGVETTMTIRYAQAGDKNIYNYEEALNSMLTIGNTTYYIMHQTQSIAKYTNVQVSEEEDITFSKAYFEEYFVRTGNEKIDDIEYYFEEYAVGDTADSSVRYYFDSDDKLSYIRLITVNGGYINEILELSSEIEEGTFDIPEGYKEVEMSSVSNTE